MSPLTACYWTRTFATRVINVDAGIPGNEPVSGTNVSEVVTSTKDIGAPYPLQLAVEQAVAEPPVHSQICCVVTVIVPRF